MEWGSRGQSQTGQEVPLRGILEGVDNLSKRTKTNCVDMFALSTHVLPRIS